MASLRFRSLRFRCLRFRSPAVIAGSLVAAVSLVVSGARADRPASPAPGVRQLTCEADARVPVAVGVVVNNAWNRAAAGGRSWQQCILARDRDGRVDYGWSWDWPAKEKLYAYPERLVGRSPWSDQPSNDARFPVSIDRMRSMHIDYDIESHGTGKKNLALEFWLTDPSIAAGGPTQASIRAEVMIWTDASPGMETAAEPPGETVEIDGRRWAVRVRHGWGDASGGSTHTWTFITYQAVQHATEVHYDARLILQHAVDRGWIDARDQVEGVELGNEIVSGSGSTWVRRFDVSID